MKKPFKTIKENQAGRNIKSINLKDLTKAENKELIKKADAGKLPGYHTVKPEEGEKFLRSNPDRKKKNNLDPKINK
jgi:hypothetical protein